MKRSILNLHRRLLVLRRTTPALQVGTYRPLDGLPEDVFGYVRQDDSSIWTILLNFGTDDEIVPLDTEGDIILSTMLDREEGCIGRMLLRDSEGVIIRHRDA